MIFLGYLLEVFIISDGFVVLYLFDFNVEESIFVILLEVEIVNFMWEVGLDIVSFFFFLDKLNFCILFYISIINGDIV